MLRPEYLKSIGDNLSYQFQELEGMIIWDIARRINSKINGEGNFTATAEIQYQDLLEMGYDPKYIKAEIARRLKLTVEEVDKLIYESALISYNDEKAIYLKANKHLPDFADNGFIQNLVRATQDRLKDAILNLSNTIGFASPEGFYGVDDYFKRTMDKAVFQTASGLFDYQAVSRRFIKEMAESGVRSIDYESGVSRSLESTVRNNLLTGLSQLAGAIAVNNAESMDQDLMEITAHSGARPSHATWQGKIVSLSGKKGYLSKDDIGYGSVVGFQGANCYHMWYPFFEGVSERKYTDEELAELNDQSKKYEFNGKKYSEYEAGQKMRQIERSIRKTKRELIGLDATKDKEMFTIRSIFLRRQRELYKEFSKVTGKPMEDWRHQVYNFDRKKAGQANAAFISLDKASNKKYNSTSIQGYYNDYRNSVKKGMISPLVREKDYFKYKAKIDDEVVGTKTSNGIEIKGQSKHFIERVFGTMEDPKTKKPRDGVDIPDIKDALTNPLKITENKKDGKVDSYKYIGEKGTVSVNPNTGNLIQCNPTDERLIRRLRNEGKSK